jgi:hypothetical protein
MEDAEVGRKRLETEGGGDLGTPSSRSAASPRRAQPVAKALR